MALLPGLALSAALGVDENRNELSASAPIETVEVGAGTTEFVEGKNEGAPVKCCWVFFHGQWMCVVC
jgi:hypothetical protein